MSKNKTHESKSSGIIACIVSVLLTFSIFMFFMDPIKWTIPQYVENDIATPSFFNLMFGGGGSKGEHFVFNSNIGMIFIFVIQILIILGCVASLISIKKGYKKPGYLILGFVGVLALTNGILTLCCGNFNLSITYSVEEYGFHESYEIKEMIKLAYGAYVYGITMLVAGVAAFLPYGIKYCLKK